jgi:hypothetical protein
MPSGPDGMKATNKRNPNHDGVSRRAHSGKERSLMYQIVTLLGLMLFTWGAAVWASFGEESAMQGGPSYMEIPRKAA